MLPLQTRTAALVALFTQVATTRMEGVPILNPALRVEAVGFEVLQVDNASNMPLAPVLNAKVAINTEATVPAPPASALGAVGILITPWFMNLVWFTLERVDEPGRAGSNRPHAVGHERFDFIAGYEDSFGSYEACSLFSPMFEFPDQAAAVATAQAVLEELRRLPEPVVVPVAQPVHPRRAFLFGRRATAGAGSAA